MVVYVLFCVFFFFKQKTAYEMRISDWSSDVCSSDLVEYDQYPSEFFKNVNVYKSADASLIAAGISGTVDLRMLRPLERGERVVALSARGQMNENGRAACRERVWQYV